MVEEDERVQKEVDERDDEVERQAHPPVGHRERAEPAPRRTAAYHAARAILPPAFPPYSLPPPPPPPMARASRRQHANSGNDRLCSTSRVLQKGQAPIGLPRDRKMAAAGRGAWGASKAVVQAAAKEKTRANYSGGASCAGGAACPSIALQGCPARRRLPRRTEWPRA